jgi:hypothetical protein
VKDLIITQREGDISSTVILLVAQPAFGTGEIDWLSGIGSEATLARGVSSLRELLVGVTDDMP